MGEGLGCGLGCTLALSVTYSLTAVAVNCLWHYVSVMPLPFTVSILLKLWEIGTKMHSLL